MADAVDTLKVRMIDHTQLEVGLQVALQSYGKFHDPFQVATWRMERGSVRLFRMDGIGFVYWLDEIPVAVSFCYFCGVETTLNPKHDC